MELSSIFKNHPFQWAFVLFALFFLAYLARVISKEKEDYLKKAILLSFNHFEFLIPSWWSVVSKTPNKIIFKRADTYYDWKASFTWLDFHSQNENQGLKDYFATLVAKKGIQFDAQEVVIKENSDYQNHPLIRQFSETEMIRVEGTATENFEHRIYYDAYLVRDQKQRGFLFCESRSSILNGLLEGPYFEEVCNRLTKTPMPSSSDNSDNLEG